MQFWNEGAPVVPDSSPEAMASSAPASQPEEKAGGTSAKESLQPGFSHETGGPRSGLALPSIPDHELLRCIGRGAYGAVWLARNVMGTHRAIKIVHREDFARDRPFTREYEGLLKFEPISRSHPNLMQILHVGRRDGYFYYVTELADDAGPPGEDGGSTMEEGSAVAAPAAIPDDAICNPQSYVPRTLQEDLRRRGRLPVRECLRVAVALASALQHLHDHALVHRDVKPPNVIFVHGVPKLSDIGLVASAGDSRSIVGTEGYLPPEGPGSPQADLYALGKLLYEISTGMNRREYPRLPANLRELPDAPGLLEFNEVLLRACAKDTARRYHRADELLADLVVLERGESVKRLRRLERHHAVFKRVVIGALAVGILVSAAWWQTWRAQRIARRHLAQLHLNEGTQRMARGDSAAALPWLVGALELETGDPLRERAHRVRLGSVLERCPLPVAHFYAPESRILSADLNRQGTVVATGHDDGWVRLWDARSGDRLQQLKHDFPVLVCQFLPSGDRLLTVTVGQKAHLWDVANPGSPLLTHYQTVEFGADAYTLVLDKGMGEAYLSKGSDCTSVHRLEGPFENLTLGLRLAAQGDDLWVHYEVRRTDSGGAPLIAGVFRDSPAAEPLETGVEDRPTPLWGRVLLGLLELSSAEHGESGRVVWDGLRARCYPSKEPASPWRVVDDFSGDNLTNWAYYSGVLEEGRTCRLENGQLTLSCQRLPPFQPSARGVMFLEPFELSRGRTLEIEADLISAQAPRPIVTLGLYRPNLTPLTAPDRSYVFDERWLVLAWWDGMTRIWDLDGNRFATASRPEGATRLELRGRNLVRDIDLSVDRTHLAQVESGGVYSVWNLDSGRQVVTNEPSQGRIVGVRFSPDGRFLAVSHELGLDLLRPGDWQLAQRLKAGDSFGPPRFSPRGNRLAAVRDEREVVVWNLDDLSEPSAVLPHELQVNRVIFSPDGRYLASRSANHLVRVWDVVRQERLGSPMPGDLAQFSADGAQLLVLSEKSGVWLWDLSRVVDNTLTIPPAAAGGASATSTNRGITAQIEGGGITLKTATGHYSLETSAEVALKRVAFSADERSLIAESADQRGWIWDLDTRSLIGPPRPLRYDAGLENYPLPQLAVASQDARNVSDLAALLGGQRPDGAGGMTLVDVAGQARRLGEMKRAHPNDFGLSSTSRLRWHQEQAQAAESVMDWDAALFHWERAVGQKPEMGSAVSEAALEERLNYARQAAEALRRALSEGRSRWSVILRRPSWAKPEMLDLSDYYTRSLGEPSAGGKAGVSFRELASGVQELRGTIFDIRGIIQLNHSNCVTVPVGRTCERIHFLHATAPTVIGAQEPAGRYQVAYADGELIGVELRRPRDVPPYSAGGLYTPTLTEWSGSSSNLSCAIVWWGLKPGSPRSRQSLSLTRMTWELPASHLEKVVEKIELRAASTNSVPLVFAITVE